MSRPSKFLIGVAVLLVLALLAWVIFRGHEAAERATVTINDQTLPVRVADNPWERRQGLSGLTSEDVNAQGMIFVFPKAEVQHFWMKGMKLNLDVVWIRNGKIAAIDENIPAPKPGEAPATMTSDPIPVDMVLELPAGYVKRFGITAGSLVKVQLP